MSLDHMTTDQLHAEADRLEGVHRARINDWLNAALNGDAALIAEWRSHSHEYQRVVDAMLGRDAAETEMRRYESWVDNFYIAAAVAAN